MHHAKLIAAKLIAKLFMLRPSHWPDSPWSATRASTAPLSEGAASNARARTNPGSKEPHLTGSQASERFPFIRVLLLSLSLGALARDQVGPSACVVDPRFETCLGGVDKVF